MKIRENLSPLINIPKDNSSIFPGFEFKIGKVYAIILDENTPSKELFDSNGGWDGLGTIFYLDYNQAKNIDDTKIENCKKAKSFFPNQKYYPLIGELVLLLDLPSITSQVSTNFSQKYYLSSINLWNNIHHNIQVAGNTIKFKENSHIVSLLPNEGDYILEGRFGHSLRFTSNNGNPSILLSNGHANESQVPYKEDINKDKNSIYINSSGSISIDTDRTELNNLTKPIKPKEYKNSQIVINSDRLLLNSKKDDILLFAKTNIELYTKNIININANERVQINSPRIFLGSKDNQLPTEPLLLGNQTVLLLSDLIKELALFANKLTQAKSTPQGTPILDITYAASNLVAKLNNIINKLNNIKSKVSYTS